MTDTSKAVIDIVTPGKDTSEFLAGKRLVYAGFGVAIVTSVLDLPITPENVQAYFIMISESAKEWTRVLAYPILGIYGIYTASRAYIKK